MDGRRHRGRGAPARVQLDQGVRPAVQRPLPRRQDLPVARRHDERGVPAAARLARGAAARACGTSARTRTPGRSARRSTRCCGSSRRGPARPGCSSGTARSAGRACSATSTSARRRASGGSAPTSTGRSSRTSATSWPGRPTSSSGGSSGRCCRRARRRSSSGPPGCATTSRRCSAPWRSRRWCCADGTDADVVAFAEDELEAAVQVFHVRGGRVRGQRGWVVDKVEDGHHRASWSSSSSPSSTGRRGRRAAELGREPAGHGGAATPTWPAEADRPGAPRGAGARAAARRRRAGGVAAAAARQPGGPAGPAARRQEGAAGDRDRNAAEALAQHKTRRASDLTTRSRRAAGDPGGARARRRAAAHRVHRRLPRPGHRRGGLDGGVRGRPGPQVRVPPVRHQGPGRQPTTWRPSHEVITAPVPPVPG